MPTRLARRTGAELVLPVPAQQAPIREWAESPVLAARSAEAAEAPAARLAPSTLLAAAMVVVEPALRPLAWAATRHAQELPYEPMVP